MIDPTGIEPVDRQRGRRAFMAMFAGGVLAAPVVAWAQQAAKVPRIGVLVPAEPESPNEPNIAAFRRGLRDRGDTEQQNVVVEYRYAQGKHDLYPALVAQPVGLNVDVIVVGSGPATLAAKRATQTIPIVGVSMGGDPVGAGLVSSLRRPGGNVTGVSGLLGGGFVGKWIELLKQAAPRITRASALAMRVIRSAQGTCQIYRPRQKLSV